MVQATEEVKIDTNLYSRQIGTFGIETMGKLIKMKVLIIGSRGLGVETAKNLILAGPASVDIHDPTTVAVEDLGSNFYLKQEDVGKTTRAEASITQLKELNPYVKVNVAATFDQNDVANYNVVVVTENLMGLDALIALNEKCRASKIGFILSETLGAAGYIFLDYGSDFVITDENGEQTKSFIVTNITQDEKACVTVHEDKRHSY